MVVVLESIFTFNLSIPLNYLLEGFENRVLVIQVRNQHPRANLVFCSHEGCFFVFLFSFFPPGLVNCFLYSQGMKDPLPNSRPILAMLREHCKGLTVRELDAGIMMLST